MWVNSWDQYTSPARFDPEVVDALDRAVEAGIGPTRAAIIVAVVHEWLRSHGEDAIAESYRQRYGQSDAVHDELVADLASFSVAACLAVSDRSSPAASCGMPPSRASARIPSSW